MTMTRVKQREGNVTKFMEKRFTVGTTNAKYRDNYDRVFQGEPEPAAPFPVKRCTRCGLRDDALISSESCNNEPHDWKGDS